MNCTDHDINSNSTITDLEPVTHSNSLIISEDVILGPALVWTYTGLRVLQCILAMGGNLVTIISVFTFEFLWDNSGCRLVASLALADFFMGLHFFFERIARHLFSSNIVLKVVCYVQVIIELLTGAGNLYCTLLCTIDRFIFVIRPLRYFTIVTPRRAMWAIAITWMLICIQIALSLGLAPTPNDQIIQHCGWVSMLPRWTLILSHSQFVLIAFCAIVPIYCVIGYTSWKLSMNMPDIINYPPEARAMQRAKLRENKMAKTIGWVLITFLLCYTPANFIALVHFFYTPPLPFGIILANRIVILIYNMQAILNPFIYGYRNAPFKKAYKKMLGSKCQVTSIEQ